MSKDEIFGKLKDILVNEFEIDEGSIDSIDLIQKMKEFMPAGTKFDPAIFKTVKNVQDVVEALVPYMG